MPYISKRISKLGSASCSVGLLPEFTCRKDAPCAKLCYAKKGHYCFNTVHEKLLQNTIEWHADPMKFQNEIIEACKLYRFFRWFHAGDIPDEEFYDMMNEVAVECPYTQFLAFTKQYEIVNSYISQHGLPPENLKVVLSAWGDKFQPENPHNLPIAYINLKHEKCTIPEQAKHCAGSCEDCIMRGNGGCWTLKYGESVVFNQH